MKPMLDRYPASFEAPLHEAPQDDEASAMRSTRCGNAVLTDGR